MEFMEPKDIDWSRVVSRYVRDETYEGIAAPRWADLADPNAGRADVDDEAWFCRPDCRHPRTAEDFVKTSPSPKGKLLRSVSAMLPFAERDTNATELRSGSHNLKWRGVGPRGAVATFTPPKPKAAPKKRAFLEDSENQDPALATPPPAAAAASSRPPFGAARWAKNAKEAIKSSAEKRPDNAEKEALLGKHTAPRKLKSTLSAKNLFSGKDILGQISEFYDELKRMVGGAGSRHVPDTQEDISSSPMKCGDGEEKNSYDDGIRGPVPSPTVKELARQETVKKSSPIKGKMVGLKVEAGKARSPSVRKEVKATSPAPQRFPSPSANSIKNVKAGGMATAGSQLKKPLKEPPSKDPENKKRSYAATFWGYGHEQFQSL